MSRFAPCASDGKYNTAVSADGDHLDRHVRHAVDMITRSLELFGCEQLLHQKCCADMTEGSHTIMEGLFCLV